MDTFDQGSTDFVASFSAQRQRLLHHVGAMLSTEQAKNEKAGLPGTLATALEMLKVAEEELLEERRRYAVAIEAKDRNLAFRQALFDRAPVALLVTTMDTTIREANRAAARLLGLGQEDARGKTIIAMAPRQNAGFKEQIGHAIELGAVAAWSFTLSPLRDVPLVVTASVEVVDDVSSLGMRALYWSLRPTL